MSCTFGIGMENIDGILLFVADEDNGLGKDYTTMEIHEIYILL